jgi:hypothetical protein
MFSIILERRGVVHFRCTVFYREKYLAVRSETTAINSS